MDRRTLQIRLAGQSYRIVTTAGDDDIARLSAVVEQKLAEVNPRGRLVAQQALVLAALALAHDLEEQRDRARRTEVRAREALTRLVERIDEVLDEPSPAPPPVVSAP